ncbi:hypothetical protein EVAR_75753_1 [Eumeta japonica]|uniref:Nucleic-acid-binding protein from transposon X-element n=1 Tax=Eumeta variegata TaxID=151549 RepID=A0A4C1TG77_EUMVA|nr:hypothetical protein EVAR_75753_1 [Eumeta japonica]
MPSIHTPLKKSGKLESSLGDSLGEIPIEEVKENLCFQNLPVQLVHRILNCSRESLDLVLVSSTVDQQQGDESRLLQNQKRVLSLSGIIAEQPRKRALPGQCHNCQSYGHSSKHRFNPARCIKCLGNHSTAQCTRNKDIDGPPACVLCKQKGHTVNYLGYPRAPKRAPPPKKAAPRRAPARTVSTTLSFARAAAGPRSVRPQRSRIRHPPRTT